MKPLQLVELVMIPALILAAGVVVVQAHAIPYWQAQMGPAVGLVASLAAELVGLYLVYQPGRLARTAGLLLVTVMVLVPAWQIAGPEYRAWRATEMAIQAAPEKRAAATAQLPLIEQDIAAKEVSLREDEAKSAVRAGWLETLTQQRAGLDALRAQRRDLEAKASAPTPATYDWWAALPTVLPVLVLLIAFQAVNAYAVRRISGARFGEIAIGPPVAIVESEPGSRRESPPGNDGNAAMESVDSFGIATAPVGAIAKKISTPGNGNSCPMESMETPVEMEIREGNLSLDDFTIRRLQEAVRETVRAKGVTGKVFCEAEGIQPRDLSLFLRHFEHRKAGKRTAPELVIQRLAARFLPDEQGEARME